jgi:Na+/melibiose symporter-like transporter
MNNKTKNLIFIYAGLLMAIGGLSMFLTREPNDLSSDLWFTFAFAGICTSGVATINFNPS